jgi:pyridoxal phosphate enzyme (YggS family)
MSLQENLALIKNLISSAAQRANRDEPAIALIAVTKTFPAESIRAAHDAGLRHFAENRLQEAESKRPQLADLNAATWHFIGHLQSNKVRKAAQLFDRIDSVDSLALAQKLNEAAAALSKKLPILIEVHTGEATKSGVSENDLPALAKACTQLANLNLQGLMTIPPYADDPESVRPYFKKLRALRDQTAAATGRPLPILSMGMSHDFEIAIEEGATEIRIGTALFGRRNNQP